MKLVQNWRRLWRAWSVQISSVNLLGYALYYVPAIQEYVSPKTFLAIMAGLLVLSLVVRPIKQKKVSDADQ